MSFTGFPEVALEFYEGLAADNTRAYWTDHKADYDRAVKAPMTELLAALEPEFGPAALFRPYRDVRFSKDKTPYKTQAAAHAHEEPLYLALSADGLFLAGGYWRTTTDQARRLRDAFADDRTGAAFVALRSALLAAGLTVDGDRLKRLPKPWGAEHPRADLLTLKALTGSVQHEPAPWLHEPECLDRVVAGWRAVRPLNAWLAQHVGPPRDQVQR